MDRRAGSVLLTCASAILIPCAPAQAATRLVRIDVANFAATGDRVRGPVILRLDRVNRLRYDVRFDRSVVFTPGPDLPLLPALPSARTRAGTAPAATMDQVTKSAAAADPISDAFAQVLSTLAQVEATRADVEAAVAAEAGKARRARDDVDGLVRASDGVLQGGGAQALVREVRKVSPIADAGRQAKWPSAKIAALRGDVRKVAAELSRLPHRFDPADWAAWYQGMNKAQYDAAVGEADDLQAYVDAVGPGSAVLLAFEAIQAGLSRWLPILGAVTAEGVDYFTVTRTEGCDFAFDRTRATTVTLVAADRLAAPGTGVTRTEVVTVECTTPFSVSAGFGYSLLTNELEIGFAQTTRAGTDDQGAPTTRVTKQFAELKRSDFRVSPLLLVNTRVAEWSDTLALHVSAGAVVDMSGDAGTDVEWVAGATVSLKRSLFLTAAFHAARVPRLGGGFVIGDEVPSEITEPPLEKELDKALLIGITYKLKP